MTGHNLTQRLLVVTKSAGFGGIERNLAGFVPGMRRVGVEVEVVVLHESSDGPGPLVAVGPTMLGGGGKSPLSVLRRLIELRSRASRYDAVIGTGPEANLLVCLSAAGRARTIISEQNDPFIERRRRWNRRWSWAMRRADAVTVHTLALADELSRAGWFPDRIEVIPNAVAPEIDISTAIGHRDPVICGVGRLVPQKGYEDLVEAFASLGDRAAGWSLLLVGDGPERDRLERLARNLGIADRFTITGMVPEPWRLIKQASVFALCSHHEGFGNVILEAMAAGCAVVVTDCRFGPREIVRHGVDGLVVPTGDTSALKEALAELMSDETQRVNFAEAGRRRLNDFSIEAVVGQWLDLLDLTQSSAAPGHS